MQKLNTKRNIYILLTILCILLILNLQYLAPLHKHNPFQVNFDKAKLSTGVYPNMLAILSLLYFTLIIIGIVNLLSFTIKNFKKPLLNFQKQDVSLALSQEKTTQLIFFISFLLLIIYSFEWFIFSQKWNISELGIVIIFNLLLEIGVISLILKFIPLNSLGISLNLRQLYKAANAYLTMLPILLGVLVINNLFMGKIGMETSVNPAIEIFFKIKSNFLSILLFLQIALFGPVAEELLFRGFIYKLLRKKYNFIFSAISCSLIFSLMHKTAKDTLPLFVLSIMLCYIYEKARNILSPILFHIIHNLLNVSFLFVLKNLISL